MLLTVIHPDEGRLTRSQSRGEKGRDEEHIVLLLTCGTVFIELWRDCLLTDACDRSFKFTDIWIYDDLQKRYAKWHTVKL